MITILLLAVAGAVIAAIVGTLWYSNATPMGKIHMKFVGCEGLSPEAMRAKMEAAKPMMPKMYAGQLFLSFLTSLAVAFVVTTSIRNGLSFGAAFGYVAFSWLGYVVPTVGSGIIWSNCDRAIAWPKFFSDIFSSLLTLALVAGLSYLFA